MVDEEVKVQLTKRGVSLPWTAVMVAMGIAGGGATGTFAGGNEAKQEIHKLDTRLSVIETKVESVLDGVNANAAEVVIAREENRDTVDKIHDIDVRTTTILTILEERK